MKLQVFFVNLLSDTVLQKLFYMGTLICLSLFELMRVLIFRAKKGGENSAQ